MLLLQLRRTRGDFVGIIGNKSRPSLEKIIHRLLIPCKLEMQTFAVIDVIGHIFSF